MNIKIVYNKRLYKLPPGPYTLEELKTAIRKTLAGKLPERIELFVLADQCSNYANNSNILETQQLVHIITEQDLQNTISCYNKNN